MRRLSWNVLLGTLALFVVLVPGAQAAEPFGALPRSQGRPGVSSAATDPTGERRAAA